MHIFRAILDALKSSYNKVREYFVTKFTLQKELKVAGSLSSTIIAVQCFTVAMVASTATATILAAVFGIGFLVVAGCLLYSAIQSPVKSTQSLLEASQNLPIPEAPAII